jgi:integrase
VIAELVESAEPILTIIPLIARWVKDFRLSARWTCARSATGRGTMEFHRTKNIKFVQNILGHKKLENTDMYTHLIDFESDDWHAAHARSLEEENKLIEAGFEYVRYSDKH